MYNSVIFKRLYYLVTVMRKIVSILTFIFFTGLVYPQESDKNKFILQGGPNIKLKGGNVFAFLFSPADQIDWGLKIGAFIPLNMVITEK